MNATVSAKGQVTIPKAIRDDLGLTPGSILEFSEDNGRLIAVKRIMDHPISAWRGKARLPAGFSVDSYVQQVRDGA